ncbi:hypothetical protein [Methylobacterium sp. B1]|uniref:hypothetical protein n=1 Tax=Methylobacterium sp. B1 TaxID=91459 RepID=UPI00034C5D49|nr:hypothetical protein [Methylobacterium sp. B1]
MNHRALGPEFFVETALLLERDDGLIADRREAFVDAVEARVSYAERGDHDRALTAAMEHPGYLHRTVAGRDVYVPFNLAFALPGEDVLIEAIALAEAVRLGHRHAICLSGSATFLGRLDRAADLDFCEYYPSPLSTLAPAIDEKARIHGSPYLVTIKCASTDVALPYEQELRGRLDELLQPAGTGEPPKVKLDFVGTSELFGAIPVTSVVILVDEASSETGRARASFAYQEAVLCVATPPRDLLLAEEFARYLLWLKGESATWLHARHAAEVKSPLKSLKRALSAFLLMGYDLLHDEVTPSTATSDKAADAFDPVNQIFTLLNEGILARVADELRLAELRSLAPVGHALVPQDVLQNFHGREPLDAGIVDTALEGARELAEGLVVYIDELFDRVRGELP